MSYSEGNFETQFDPLLQNFALENGQFLNPDNHLILTSSSRRECSPKLPENIIKSLDVGYFSQEPKISSVNILTNMTLFSDFAFNFNSSSISLLEEDEGLLSQQEWEDLDHMLQYNNLKQAQGESLSMSICLGNKQCQQNIIGTQPPFDFNIETLRLPEVKAPTIDWFPWYTKLTSTIKLWSAEICITAMLFQLLIFFFTICDFVFGNNPHNQISLLLHLFMFCGTDIYRCFFPHQRHPPPEPSPAQVNIQLQPLSQALLSESESQ